MNILILEKFLNYIFEVKQIKKLENNNYLFILITLLSFCFTSFFSDNLKNNQALGPHTISLFIYYFFYIIFLILKEFSLFKIYYLFVCFNFAVHGYLRNFSFRGRRFTFYTLQLNTIDNQT